MRSNKYCLRTRVCVCMCVKFENEYNAVFHLLILSLGSNLFVQFLKSINVYE